MDSLMTISTPKLRSVLTDLKANKQKEENKAIADSIVRSIDGCVVRYVHCAVRRGRKVEPSTIAYIRTKTAVFAVRVVKNPNDKDNRQIARMLASQKLSNYISEIEANKNYPFEDLNWVDRHNRVILHLDALVHTAFDDSLMDFYFSEQTMLQIRKNMTCFDLKHKFISDSLYLTFCHGQFLHLPDETEF